ncbi:MAG: insulinase family protein, partial [Desulfobacterales bacterium]|nr:insulinase family protein [Desulfobacterales bacterium]
TPGTAISAVEEALYREIDRIKEEPPSDFEVQKAKNQLEAYFISTQDSILSQANLTARFEILGGTGIMDEYLENILQITPEDVSRVARKYLVEEN